MQWYSYDPSTGKWMLYNEPVDRNCQLKSQTEETASTRLSEEEEIKLQNAMEEIKNDN